MFIISLSLSDLLLGMSLPHYCINNFTAIITNYESQRISCLVNLNIMCISIASSTYNILAIAVDRYIQIFHGLRYNVLMTRSKALSIIVTLWVFSSFVFTFVVWNFNLYHFKHCSILSVLQPSVKSVVTFVCMPSIIITVILHAFNFRAAWVQSRQISQQTTSMNNNETINRKKILKITTMMSLVVGVFLTAWIPFTIMGNIYTSMDHPRRWHDVTYQLVLIVLMANSGINPLIYAWKNRSFRSAFMHLLFIKRVNDIID